ncbi:MAG: sporulation membrane protein YtaF [Clostridia bacterium]|nr:sporulation membrane protein YtaF [Clostridia bacterium]
MLFSIAILAISLSLDALGVGIAYGLRGVKIPIFPKLVICAFSILYSFLAIIAGKSMSSIFSAWTSKLIGILILGLMGSWILLQSFLSKDAPKEAKQITRQTHETLFKFVIKSLGITIQVIKNPVQGDIDQSGVIDFSEAVLLGLALSVDAIGVGIGCAFTGFSSMYIPLAIGLFQLAFLYMGTFAGGKFKLMEAVNGKMISMIPGLLLIFLAILRIY